ncbi:hypothetical protein VKI21_06885 [Cyanobacterium aponinum UTEX 3222]|uniref:hypothetical protein n=1 Tax=Cyanobacterium aponinum TaxID=379064 RepID=UPI00308B3111|nr:hypothetical protein VKI21_06885 [Cyanobacterium aponinum UTEX 3222]
MNRSYLVEVCVREYFEIEIQAADEECIFNFKDPDKQRFLYGSSVYKLQNPELFRSADKREIEVVGIVEGVDP